MAGQKKFSQAVAALADRDSTTPAPKLTLHVDFEHLLAADSTGDKRLREAPRLPYAEPSTEAKAKSFLRRGIPVVLTGFPRYDFDFERYQHYTSPFVDNK